MTLKNAALSPESIGRALFRENVLGVLLREIGLTTNIPFDQRDLAEAIYEMLTPEAREEMAPPRSRKPKPASSIVTIHPTKPATRRGMAAAVAQPTQIHARIHDHTPPPTPPPVKPPTRQTAKPPTKPASKQLPRVPAKSSR